MADGGYLDVFGHEDLRLRLSGAVERRRLAQSLLLYGPRGVGKQRLALWIAAALNCSGTPPPPCGVCRPCRFCARLEHPDVHWFFPGPRPRGATSPEQLQQKLEDQRAETLEERRRNPLYLEEAEGATGIYIGAVHTMRRLAQKSAALGAAKALVIGRAEGLVPQMGSHEAANALLKLLEEPPSDTTLILTSDVPGALLPTIRSRVQAIRVSPLPVERAATFLADRLELTADEATRLARQSGGAIGRALELQESDHEELRESASALAEALLGAEPRTRLASAHRFRPFGARGAFARILSEAQSILRDLLATSAGADAGADRVPAADLAGQRPPNIAPIIRGIEALDVAQELVERNVNPQLIVASLQRLGPGRSAAR